MTFSNIANITTIVKDQAVQYVIKYIHYIILVISLSAILYFATNAFIDNYSKKLTDAFIQDTQVIMEKKTIEEKIKLSKETFQKNKNNNFGALRGLELANLYFSKNDDQEARNVLQAIYNNNSFFINDNIKNFAKLQYIRSMLATDSQDNYLLVIKITKKINKNNIFYDYFLKENILANILLNNKKEALSALNEMKFIKNKNLNESDIISLEKLIKMS